MKTKAVLVKICGVTNASDAKWAANLGADFVGLNFFSESPRKVSLDKAREIVDSLPSFVKTVGVFVNATPEDIGKILKKVPLHILQLHGNENPAELQKLKEDFKVAIWKAIRVENEASLSVIPEFAGIADVLILDTFSQASPGGTGETFDWSLAQKAKESGIPVFVAGGLDPDNVLEAIEKVEPMGVDVASGVEKTGHPRRKDVDKMKAFIARAKNQ